MLLKYTPERDYLGSYLHRLFSNLMMISLAVLLSLLQKVQTRPPWVQSHTSIFIPQTGVGHFLFTSMLNLFLNQTLTLLYVLFDIVSPFPFWFTSFMAPRNPSTV